jgi:phenylacetyl-CoA:acceptor oxidoreductase subunit 1
MTRWAMVADLRRCVGCQTCTAACKHANATPPGVQWRRVLDMEFGSYPDVQRAFVPVGCQHCDDPPCMHVCPTTATRKRPTASSPSTTTCASAARTARWPAPTRRATRPSGPASPTAKPTATEELRHDESRMAVATKCTYCVDRIDDGLARGLTPGVDPEATPACANACIAQALVFGDVENPDSNVSRLLKHNQHFRMHEELGTGPGFYYLWDAAEDDDTPSPSKP